MKKEKVIKRARVSGAVATFEKQFMDRFKCKEYRSNEPAIFFGMYKSDYQAYMDHESESVVVWCGTDAMRLCRSPFMVDVLNNSNTRHIAISKYIVDDLQKLGIDPWFVPITPSTYKNFHPCKKGDSVIIYYRPGKERFYGVHIAKCIESMLKINFIYADGSHSQEEMIELYKQSFMGIRITPHDGLANVAMELGLMGRRIIWNGGTPNAIPYSCFPDIVNAIIRERDLKDQEDIDSTLIQKMKQYIEINDDWRTI